MVAMSHSKIATGAPNSDNKYVVEFDSRLLTQEQADANLGNGLPLEDEGPSDDNRWISSAQVFAVPTEVEVSADLGSFIELPANLGGFYVGYYNAATGDTDAVEGTAQQWFNVYAEDYSGDEEYTNDDFNEVRVTSVRFGVSGLTGINLLHIHHHKVSHLVLGLLVQYCCRHRLHCYLSR